MFNNFLNERRHSLYGETLGNGFRKDMTHLKREFGLSYFGEFLERYSQTAITVYDILRGVSYYKTDIISKEMYGTQMEGFLKDADKEMQEESSFVFKLSYFMFLQKVGNDDKAKEVFDSIITGLKFDEDLLLLTWAVNQGYAKFEKYMTKAIADVLIDNEFTYNIENMVDRCIKKYRGETCYDSDIVYLRLIQKTFNLKISSFSRDRQRFEEINAIKNIGTARCVSHLERKALNLSEFHYAIISMKIAEELYVDGKAKESLLITHKYSIRKCADPNDILWVKIRDLEFFNGSYRSNPSFKFDEVNYNVLRPENYGTFIKLFDYGIRYEKVEQLVEREDFFNLLSEKPEGCGFDRRSVDNIVIYVITHSEKQETIRKYFGLAPSLEQLSESVIYALYKNDIATEDDLYNKLIDSDNETSYCFSSFIKRLAEDGNVLLIKNIFTKMMNNAVTIDYRNRRSEGISAVKILLSKEMFNDGSCNEELLTLLNDIMFYYNKDSYYSFVLENMDNADFCRVLGITEVEKKAIYEYLLDKRYLSYKEQALIEEKVYTEEYLIKRDMKERMERKFEYAIKYEDGDYIDEIRAYIKEKAFIDDEIREYISRRVKEVYCKVSSLRYVHIAAAKLCMEFSIIDKEEARNTLIGRLDKMLEM